MSWHNVLLFFSGDFYNIDSTIRHSRLVLDLIKPVTDHFRVKDLLRSFHFFYEGSQFELRLELDDGVSRDEVRTILREQFAKVAGLIDVARSDVVDYQPEVGDDQFGVDGWQITKKLFEYGSRLAIALCDAEFRKGRILREGKLIHCMLNSLNYDWPTERDFHITEAVVREVIIMSQERKVKPKDVNIEEAKQHVKDYTDKLKIRIAE